MAVATVTMEQIVTQVRYLPYDERLRLAHRIIDTLKPPRETNRPRYLVYGQFRGPQMSTDEDFRVAEWRPTEMELIPVS